MRRAAAVLALTLAVAPVARADTIRSLQFGSYLSPSASLAWEEFSVSNGYPQLPAQRFSYDYAASVFESALEIRSFTFFNNQQRPRNLSTNVFAVFMSAGNGPLSYFGQFAGVSPLCGPTLACAPNCGPVSLTCLPLGAGGWGSFFYDPSLGVLHIEMIQTLDIAANVLFDPLFWHDQYESGGSGLVTRFDGVTVAPEPGTLVLLATGLVGMLGWRRRMRRALMATP